MSSEKSYGQIGEEAYQAMRDKPWEWKDIAEHVREYCEAAAQAVISEFLRRNGEPVGEVVAADGDLKDLQVVRWIGEPPEVGAKLYIAPTVPNASK